MRVLLASAHPYIPQIAGGAQSSTDELVVELRRVGHEAAVLAGLTGAGLLGLRARLLLKLMRFRAVRDRRCGYSVFRCWFPERIVGEVSSRFRPDAAVLMSGRPVALAREFQRAGVPVVIYFRNVEVDDLGGDPRELGACSFVANSQFTADRFRSEFGIDSQIVLPLFQAERYCTATERRCIAFINPHTSKGSDLAIMIAERCPEFPFLFVEGWTLEGTDREALLRRISRLTNVTLVPRRSDMASIYRQTRILLVPSIWEEAFGRVAAEAHYSGIPVLASNRGGLPEAVGPGGLLLDADASVEAWVEALRSLWHDEALYRRLSDAAVQHSRRTALDRDLQIARLIGIIENAIERHGSPAREGNMGSLLPGGQAAAS